jgi:hypothetical protein
VASLTPDQWTGGLVGANLKLDKECQIFLRTTYQNGEIYTKRFATKCMYQIATKYTYLIATKCIYQIATKYIYQIATKYIYKIATKYT